MNVVGQKQQFFSVLAEQVTAAIRVDLAGGAEKLLTDLIWISVFSGRFAAENETENVKTVSAENENGRNCQQLSFSAP